MLEYLTLRMVYKVGVEVRNRQKLWSVYRFELNEIGYRVTLYNNSHTIYTVVFSVLLLFFYFFFSFQTQWADQFHISAPTPGYFALRKEIIEIDLLVFRTIHVCGSSKFIFANKGKRKERTWSNEVTIHFGNILWNVWETTRFQEIRILFKLSILLYLRRSINFLTKS